MYTNIIRHPYEHLKALSYVMVGFLSEDIFGTAIKKAETKAAAAAEKAAGLMAVALPLAP